MLSDKESEKLIARQQSNSRITTLRPKSCERN